MATPADDAAFLTRNAVDALPAGGLRRRLEEAAREGRPLRAKLGLDPTAPDLHLGHTVVLQKLREFQDRGHRVVLIVGDYTARVGDPSGRSATRPALSGEEIDAHARTYQDQAFRVLRDDPELLEVRRNSEWLDMAMEDLFRLARTATVAQLLERNDFAKRFAAGTPISMLELLYPLLQGYDSVAIAADVELGGTDQTFNLMLGRDVQRAYGMPEQSVLTMPILAGDRRHREDVQVAGQPHRRHRPARGDVRPHAAPARRGHARLVRAAGHRAAAAGGTGPRDAKRALARAIVARFHGEAAAAGRRGRLRPRASSRTRSPTRCPTTSCRSATGPSTCRRWSPTPSAARAPRPGGYRPGRRAGWTALRWRRRRGRRLRAGRRRRPAGRQAPVRAAAASPDQAPDAGPAALFACEHRGRRGARPDPRCYLARHDAASTALRAGGQSADHDAGATLVDPRRTSVLRASLEEGSTFPSRARRSLKTQQHAHHHRAIDEVCVQVRSADP